MAEAQHSDAAVGDTVRAVLDRLEVAYDVMTIDPDFADTAAFCAKYGIPLEQSANTIIVASKKEPKQYCACLVLATTRLDVNHAVRKLMNTSKVSFATGDETKALTGMMIGGVTVFALPADLPIYVDERVMACPWIIVGGGGRSTKIKLAPDGLRRLPNVTIVPGLAMDVTAARSNATAARSNEDELPAKGDT
jgi:prolyl-tRNA editing enzyme YbaK/EbsC (Cys-tRNA(Pro) deacylase)